MKLAPTWHWRRQYSDGDSDSCSIAPSPNFASWDPSAPEAPESRPR